MAMSRASMQQQLKGNRMKKKNVGGFLETFSPAYSIAKGKGPIGEAVRGGKGMGILGMLASQADKGKK